MGQKLASHSPPWPPPTATEQAAGVACVSIPGRAGPGPRAARCWNEAARAAAGASRVVLDLRQIEQLNRRSVAGLVRCLLKLRKAGAIVALAGVKNEVLALLELNGVPHLALICESPVAAARLLKDFHLEDGRCES